MEGGSEGVDLKEKGSIWTSLTEHVSEYHECIQGIQLYCETEDEDTKEKS